MMSFRRLTEFFLICCRRLHKEIEGPVRFCTGKAILGKSGIDQIPVFLVSLEIYGNAPLNTAL